MRGKGLHRMKNAVLVWLFILCVFCFREVLVDEPICKEIARAFLLEHVWDVYVPKDLIQKAIRL